MSGFSITLTVPAGERDLLIADLWESGTTGITEDDNWIRAFFDRDTDAHEILRRYAAYRPHLETEEERDWVAHARSLWEPFPVGERFYLVPEWMDDPAPCGRVRLRIRPGLACGSGAHPATQLCLEALERLAGEGVSVLDVGTGSGILAEAALLLGASPVWACDIDDEATRVAAGNLAGAPARPLFFTGSLRSVRDASADVVVANLNAATLARLAGDLKRASRRRIAVSGFREAEAGEVAQRFGIAVSQQLEREDWICLIF